MNIRRNKHNDKIGSSRPDGTQALPAPIVPQYGRKKRTRAQSLMEFAIGAPLLFLLVFGIIDISRLVQARVSVNNAAREGIRYAITGEQRRDPVSGNWITRTDTIREMAINGLTGLPLAATDDQNQSGFYSVEINPEDGGKPRTIVDITVRYNVSMITPLVNAIIPYVIVRGYERAINEEWGPVQTFDHANIPPTPVPLPTWTPYLSPTITQSPTVTSTPTITPSYTATSSPTVTGTPTHTRTVTPTNTPLGSHTATRTRTPLRTDTPTNTFTRTNTPKPTITSTPTRTYTPTVTHTFTRTFTPSSTPTVTVTPTPVRRLVISQVVGRKRDGSAQPLDIQVTVRDDLGAAVDGASVDVTAAGTSGNWSGKLPDMGGGSYKVCDVGSFGGNSGGGITITATASKAGYYPSSPYSANATRGSLTSCPP